MKTDLFPVMWPLMSFPNFLAYADDMTLMAESEEKLKSFLMKVKQSEKAGLQLNIKKIRLWHLVPTLHGKQMGKMWKQCQISFSWAPKSTQMVTAVTKLKDAWPLDTNLDNVLKHRDISLPTNAHIVKALVFPVVMYGCESWSIKQAEHQRIDAFKLWCWRRLFRVPWTARRSNHSILKEINPEYSLERQC